LGKKKRLKIRKQGGENKLQLLLFERGVIEQTMAGGLYKHKKKKKSREKHF